MYMKRRTLRTPRTPKNNIMLSPSGGINPPSGGINPPLGGINPPTGGNKSPLGDIKPPSGGLLSSPLGEDCAFIWPDYQYTFDSDDNKKAFRINAKQLFITIKSHVGQEYIDYINSKFPIKDYFYGHETGKENEYDHTHLVIAFEKKVNIKDPRSLDFNNIHPSIEKVKNWKSSIKYAAKDGKYFTNMSDHAIKSLLADNSNASLEDTIIAINSSKNPTEAFIKCAKNLKDIVPIERIFANKNFVIDKQLLDKYTSCTYNDWQAQINDMLLEIPNDRTVNWIVDLIGGSGKSFFSRKFRFHHSDECIVIGSTGKPADISDIIRNWMTQGNIPKYVIIDLPRSYEDKDSIYTIIENVKNGLLTCTKYKGQILEFMSPHVLIFSNWFPKVGKLSRDRWNVLHLLSGKLHPMDVNNVIKYMQELQRVDDD